jgi:hypothetical protein
LLLAIGIVESGRPNQIGKRSPWPWTINYGGVGQFYETADDAVRAVQNLRSSGMQSIDVGCFQINLFHHPDAFRNLVDGFNPLSNAMAAARFLVSLHEEFGSWEPAIAAYHSRVGSLGGPYRDHVLAVWHDSPARPAFVFVNVHVWGPNGEVGLSTGPSSWTSMTAAATGFRLPRIITASVR